LNGLQAGGQLRHWRLLQCLCACPDANRIPPSLDSDFKQESKNPLKTMTYGSLNFFECMTSHQQPALAACMRGEFPPAVHNILWITSAS